MPNVPGGTVTFLFTDIEGSTTRWEQHPQAMRAALARHDELLQEGIAAHGGVVVTERGEGDSFFALFARAGDALGAACAVQRALVAEPWPEAVGPLRVRMALHTGEAPLSDGQDYRGAAVNRCARLRAVAHGGQVLLSGATYELVRDLLPPDVTLRDLGEHRLKDLTRAEHIFQVLHPDLPTEFPPLKTLDRQRHNLPVQLTALIGREREISAVRERLLDPLTRLLTLTGPGGTGKTRLALQVAAEVLDAFPYGVYFVALATLSDPTLVVPTIAQTLGVTEAGGRPLRDVLHAFLSEKRLLLVLDNFEQVLDAAPVVTDLLAASARLRIMVTSRAVLHVQGERVYAVPPLALPPMTPLPHLERLTQYEAVRLFIERARDVKPDFAVTNETAPAVAEICVRLDGLPLAIELAAARVRLFTPPALLSRLANRLGVLTSGARDLPGRQRTLRATIDWSYSLLTAGEQALFARLSVFVGGGTLDAIEALCNADGTLDVLGAVESLLEKSLLGQTEVAGETRFVLLETIHEYARERLEASAEAEALRQTHATWYLALAEEGEGGLYGPEQHLWMSRLEAERDNLRAAFAWGLAHAGATALRLVGALWMFWFCSGDHAEGRRWAEQALALSPGGTPRARARALNTLPWLLQAQDDYAAAAVRADESLALARALADADTLIAALMARAMVAAYQGDYLQAYALLEESLVLARRQEHRFWTAAALNNLGDLAVRQGAWDQARVWLEESVTLFRALRHAFGVAISLLTLAEMLLAQGDREQARPLLEEGLTAARQAQSKLLSAVCLYYLGRIAREDRDDERAVALQRESLALAQKTGDKVGSARSVTELAVLAALQGQRQRAARLLGAVAALSKHHPRLPLGQAWYMDLPASVRADLAEEALAVAWAEGQSLSLEQAVAEALGEDAHASCSVTPD